MNRLMASGGEAASASHRAVVVASADRDHASGKLLLEVAFEAQVGISLAKHAGIHRAVGVVTDHAAFTCGFVFINKRPPLGHVAFEAKLVVTVQGLRSAGDDVALVRVVAVGATDFALGHRVMRRQVEPRPHLQMALEAGLGGAARIGDRPGCATRFVVLAARPVTRLAADLQGVRAFGLQMAVRGGLEIAHRFGVALGAAFVAHKCRTSDVRGRIDGPRDRAAGHEGRRHSRRSQNDKECPTVRAQP